MHYHLTLGWPIVVVVCVSVGLASVLVLYLVVRIRSGNRHRRSTMGTGDDVHSQMEWEDDIGLNITVNPLDETKVSLLSFSNRLVFTKKKRMFSHRKPFHPLSIIMLNRASMLIQVPVLMMMNMKMMVPIRMNIHQMMMMMMKMAMNIIIFIRKKSIIN